MKVLADTNIVARIAQSAHHPHAAALMAVELLPARNDDVCIVPQVVDEFWAVATRPSAANGLEMSVAQAHAEIERIRKVKLDDLTLLPVTSYDMPESGKELET